VSSPRKLLPEQIPVALEEHQRTIQKAKCRPKQKTLDKNDLTPARPTESVFTEPNQSFRKKQTRNNAPKFLTRWPE